MADSNLPKQDFAPPWLKFPSTDSSKTSSQNSYQSERNSQRRENTYHSRSEYNRLQRQTSFDFHDAKRYPQGQEKYRHHSVDDDYYGYPYGGYGYYPPNYNYEKYGMQYSSQPSLARPGSRDVKYTPGRFSQMNGSAFGPHHDLFEPYYHQGSAKRGYCDKELHKDSREIDGKSKERVGDRDRPFSEDFPLLKGSGEGTPEVKQTKPASGVWDNPPKSNRNEESQDMLKNTSLGIYKALVPSKNGQIKKNGREIARMNGSIKDSSPLSPSNKPNHREGTRQSPTPDLTIVTQPKKLGDKKSEFLRALRSESSQRNGDGCQDLNQNSLEKKQVAKETEGSPMSEDAVYYSLMNGSRETHRENNTHESMLNGNNINGNLLDRQVSNGECSVNGDSLIKHVDHIYLSGEEEEKRLLESMGWSEEDQTEYVITEDDVREFHHMLSRVREQSERGNTAKCGVLRLKLGTHFANGLLNGTYRENVESDKT